MNPVGISINRELYTGNMRQAKSSQAQNQCRTREFLPVGLLPPHCDEEHEERNEEEDQLANKN